MFRNFLYAPMSIVVCFASHVHAGASANGTPYNVTPSEATQGPNPQCFPTFNPGLPGEPDDVVTFDGSPEQIRTLVNNAVPTVVEQETPLGPHQYQLSIQLNVPPGMQLFPGGLNSPGGPLTSACYRLGNAAPLQYDGPKEVINASIVYTANGNPFAGPFNVTSSFSNPWDGTFEHILPGAAGSPINGVGVIIIVQLPECETNSDCNDGDPCTIDTCINFECFHTPVNCDDGDPCTDDQCVNGICEHTPIEGCCLGDGDCDDGDCCTIDECVNNVCVHTHVKDRVPTQHAARRAFHKAHAPCLGLGGGTCDGGGGGGPPTLTGLDDLWTTHPGCDGETKWRIGLDEGDPPIPADFFDPGSEPFTGTIVFRGEPIGDPNYGDADTVVRRTSDPFDRSDPPSPTPVTVGLELVALNLVSCQPITVIVNGNSTQWDVVATISDCMPPAGSLTATKTHCNGGTYTYSLRVQQKAIFMKVGDPGTVRILDTGCMAMPFDYDALEWPDPTPWVHDFDPKLPLAVNHASTFHTGVPVDSSSTACGDYDMDNDADVDDFRTFLRSYGHVAFEPEYLPYTDYDADGDTDDADYHEWRSCRRCFVGDPEAGPPSPVPLGDMNISGQIRGDDIAQFVECMFTGNPPDSACLPADVDQNGSVDIRDIPGMVLLLLELN